LARRLLLPLGYVLGVAGVLYVVFLPAMLGLVSVVAYREEARLRGRAGAVP